MYLTSPHNGSDKIQFIMDSYVQMSVWCPMVRCSVSTRVICQELFSKKCIILCVKWHSLSPMLCGPVLWFPPVSTYYKLHIVWLSTTNMHHTTIWPDRSHRSSGRVLALQPRLAAELFLALGLIQSWQPFVSPNTQVRAVFPCVEYAASKTQKAHQALGFLL